MPPLTQTLGVWIKPTNGKSSSQLSRQKELSVELVRQLPKHDYFDQHFHHSIKNWLPFYWQEFSQTTRYTYILDNLINLDSVWESMTRSTRQDIQKAQKNLIVRTDINLDTFLNVNTATYERKGMYPPYSRQLVHRLDAACTMRNARRIFAAEDSNGQIHAVLYLVWDSSTAYYLMGGVAPEFLGSGAPSLLLWDAIKFSATVSQSFDFEGSMIESVERFFHSFGSQQTPYFRISKFYSRTLQALSGVRSWLRTRNN